MVPTLEGLGEALAARVGELADTGPAATHFLLGFLAWSLAADSDGRTLLADAINSAYTAGHATHPDSPNGARK